MDEGFMKNFENNRYDFDSDPFFQTNKDIQKHFDDNFLMAQKLYFIFFAIFITVFVCMFAFVIFLICFRLCKGVSFQEYRYRRRFNTVIPPPPPLAQTSNYPKKKKTHGFIIVVCSS